MRIVLNIPSSKKRNEIVDYLCLEHLTAIDMENPKQKEQLRHGIELILRTIRGYAKIPQKGLCVEVFNKRIVRFVVPYEPVTELKYSAVWVE